jgi:hypothetical protein
MAMDPKQERALRDGTARRADLPRDTSREAVRQQEEDRLVGERPRKRRRTAAVADIRVNLEAGTPVEQLARELGAEPVPELGGAGGANGRDKNGGRNGNGRNGDTGGNEVEIRPGEARRALKARREHSKGDGNFPRVEPGPELLDERPEDRQPRDLPKARDDRSAPKGNITAGQQARNPDLAVRDDAEPPRAETPSGFETAERAAETPKARAPRPRPLAEATNAKSTASPVRPKRGEARGPQPAAMKRGTAKRAATKSATRPRSRGKTTATRSRAKTAARGQSSRSSRARKSSRSRAR